MKSFFRKLPLALALVFLLAAAYFFSWRLIPSHQMEQTLVIKKGDLAFTNTGKSFPLDQALEIRITYPQKLKVGDKENFILSITPIQDSKTKSEQKVLNTELLMPDLQITPQNIIQTQLDADEKMLITWQISARKAAFYNGTLWIALNSDGEDASLAAMEINIEGTQLVGMNVQTITWLGFIALICWAGMTTLALRLEKAPLV